jgi:hypothetical protein
MPLGIIGVEIKARLSMAAVKLLFQEAAPYHTLPKTASTKYSTGALTPYGRCTADGGSRFYRESQDPRPWEWWKSPRPASVTCMSVVAAMMVIEHGNEQKNDWESTRS